MADSPVGLIARKQGFVVDVVQLPMLGYTRAQCRTHLRRGEWWSPARGVISPIDPDNDGWISDQRRHVLIACARALRQSSAHVISGRSAAILHGLPTVRLPPLPELTVKRPLTLGRRVHAHCYDAAIRIGDVSQWYGLDVTTVERTLVDLARHDRWDGVMAADAAPRSGGTIPSALDEALARSRGWPGVKQAREVVEFADARVESPLESVTRLRMHDDGFPTPDLQVWVGDPERRTNYWLDFVLREQGLVIEADGRAKYSGEALWEEKKREARIRALTGWRIERVTWSDVTTDWAETRQRLAHAANLRLPL
jgi:hypothetical protein